MGLESYWRGYEAPGEHNHPLPPYQLTPNSHPPALVYSRRGCCIYTATPFSTSCTDAARNRTLALSFGFSSSNRPPPLTFVTAMPATATTSSEMHHHHPVYHPPSPFDTAGLEPSLSGLVSGFWPSTPSPHLHLRTQCLQLPPLRARHNTTTLHHQPLLFDTAGPEPRLSGLVSGFWPSTPSPHLRLRTRCLQLPPLRARCNTTTLHHQPSLFDMAGPEPSLSRLVLGFWPSTPSPRLRSRTQQQQLISLLYLQAWWQRLHLPQVYFPFIILISLLTILLFYFLDYSLPTHTANGGIGSGVK